MGREFRVFGPPGTGKTTYLARQIARAAEEHGSQALLVASFTRAAATELVGRDLPVDASHVGTLHALCYRQLDRPVIAETKLEDWNTAHPQVAIGSAAGDLDEPGYEQVRETGSGDQLLADYGRLRNLRRHRDAWPGSVQQFAVLWEDFKRQIGAIDFTDMVELNLGTAPPHGAFIGFFDEAQDFTPLQMELVRGWAQDMEYIVVAGDDDQCSPGDEPVLTTDGYVPMEQLDPSKHRLAGYHRGRDLIYCAPYVPKVQRGKHWKHGWGYGFKIASRPYKGKLIVLRTAYSKTRVTPDHRIVVQWENHDDAWALYLMKRGDWWRIGICRLFGRYRDENGKSGFHPPGRARTERAEAIWLLKVVRTRREAQLLEAETAVRYGLPQTIFFANQNTGLTHINPEDLGPLHDRLVPFVQRRALKCLRDYGRDPAYPIWRFDGHKYYQRLGRISRMTIHACNFLPGYMRIPVYRDKSKPEWLTPDFRREDYDGLVYSLEVRPFQHYISGGAIVHNCIFSWMGADARTMAEPALPDDQVRILAQSYRLPRSVHEAAVKWISQIKQRVPKEYRPTDEEGVIRYAHDVPANDGAAVAKLAEQYIAQGQRVMLLASCSYMLNTWIGQLREVGLPFHNPYRRKRGDWNPLQGGKGVASSERLLAYMRLCPEAWGGEVEDDWTAGEVRLWAAALKKRGLWAKGGEALLEAMPDEQVLDPATLVQVLDEEAALLAQEVIAGDLTWYEDRLLAEKRKPMQFPLHVARRRGAAVLREEPRVVLGTIHSVKGGEADVVIMSPDLSSAGAREWEGLSTRDETIRQFYVGMTRARHTLVLLAPSPRGYHIAELGDYARQRSRVVNEAAVTATAAV